MKIPEPHSMRVVYCTDSRLAQPALIQRIKDATPGKAPAALTDAVARWFVAHVNGSLPIDMTWAPQFGHLIGPQGWTAPSADQFVKRLDHEWSRFLNYLPTNR
ncbi:MULTISPECIES: hypothetical protein [unclassified Nocardiopsis]|uniref:hypothetical protein n=1 Tax=unclassified Nocardiopsis TaxID=2649073 RepID=UPI001357985A|nr:MULTISPECIES: hypothetical protein [unclassified Nocardiopsis]